MCGRFTLYHSPEEVAERFEASIDPGSGQEMEARYNVAPTQAVSVVTQNGTRHLESYHWGLIPSWAKDPAIGSKMINARAETLTEKPSFRTALARRRCLIPADGFYEWQAPGEGSKAKTPMFLHRRDSGLFAFAGLWDEWHAPDGSPLRSCTIITTTPNAVAAPIHNRMPVILRPEDEGFWLDHAVTDARALLSLLVPCPAADMEAYPVSRRVNVPTEDGPDLVAPA